ncbi:heterokaryon incompatibility protein-domain-containing protein [Xylariaceae sp. FL0255]|nr:heterokaryon incompatibility protein-domain-containing protein [Xylariaceae sp. FL0255]
MASKMSICGRQTLDSQFRQIRILELFPGENDTECVRCQTHLANLDDHPNYEALSYAWGQETSPKVDIWLNNERFQITTNLYEALSSLRLVSDSRYLWVDLICIDQNNTAERARQVTMMQEIYMQTTGAILWLGSYGVQPSDLTPRSVPTVTWLKEDNVKMAFGLLRTLASGDHLVVQDEKLCCTPADIESLGSVLNVDWWYRMWTAQEAMLSPTAKLVIGREELPFSTLLEACSRFMRHQDTGCCIIGFGHPLKSAWEYFRSSFSDLCEKLSDFLFYWVHDQTSPDEIFKQPDKFFMHTIGNLRHRKATDHRDMVYASLPIVRATFPGQKEMFNDWPIKVNYDVPWRSLYEDTIVQMIRSMSSLLPLVRGEEINRDEMLPSWVPDWHAQVASRVLDMGRWVGNGWHYYNAASSRQSVLSNPHIQGQLSLKGLLFDKVTHVVAARMISKTSEEVIETLNLWKRVYLQNHSPDSDYSTGGVTCLQAFSRLTCMELHAHSILYEKIGMFGFKWNRDLAIPDVTDEESWLAHLRRYAIAIPLVAAQVFFITANGYIGVAPCDVRLDDTVHILWGGNMPIILRSDPITGHYRYIGSSYVQGIMDGEASGSDLDQRDVILIRCDFQVRVKGPNTYIYSISIIRVI